MKLTPEQQAVAAANVALAKHMADKFCRKLRCRQWFEEMFGSCLVALCRAAAGYREGIVGYKGVPVEFAGYYCPAAWREMIREFRKQLAKGFSEADHEMKRRRNSDASFVPAVVDFDAASPFIGADGKVGRDIEAMEELEAVAGLCQFVSPKWREMTRRMVMEGISPTEAADLMGGGRKAAYSLKNCLELVRRRALVKERSR